MHSNQHNFSFQLKYMTPNASTVRSFKFLDNDQTVNNLKSELPTYFALTEDIIDVDSLLWWEKIARSFPSGQMHARKSFYVNHLQHQLKGYSHC